MQKKMQNLFKKEEWIILNLQNAGYQVKTYLKQLNELVEKYELADLKEKAAWFKKIFNYYKEDLIPAIQETALLEKRHIKVFGRNPDPLFDPKVEIDSHQILSTQFLARFEQIHKSFYEFCIELKKHEKK